MFLPVRRKRRPIKRTRTTTVTETKRQKRAKKYSFGGLSTKMLVLGGFPRRKTVRLKYASNQTYNASALSPAINLFLANSAYDPDNTGGGHQPSGFDTWMALYENCTVVKSKITVTFVNTNNTNVNPGLVGVVGSAKGDIVTLSPNVEDILEQHSTSIYPYTMGVQAAGKLPRITRYFDAAKEFGKPYNTIIGDAHYQHNASANPAEGYYFEVFVYSPDNAVDPGNITLRTEIEYICVFTERRRSINS